MPSSFLFNVNASHPNDVLKRNTLTVLGSAFMNRAAYVQTPSPPLSHHRTHCCLVGVKGPLSSARWLVPQTLHFHPSALCVSFQSSLDWVLLPSDPPFSLCERTVSKASGHSVWTFIRHPSSTIVTSYLCNVTRHFKILTN